jgi:hypothetical protein
LWFFLQAGLRRLLPPWDKEFRIFIAAVPFFAAMLSWPIGFVWVGRGSVRSAQRWFTDQLLLVGAGIAFGAISLWVYSPG